MRNKKTVISILSYDSEDSTPLYVYFTSLHIIENVKRILKEGFFL